MEYSSLRPSNFENLTSEEKVENVKRRYKLLRAQIDSKSENAVTDQQSAKSKTYDLSQKDYNEPSQESSSNQRASELNNLKDRLRPRNKG